MKVAFVMPTYFDASSVLAGGERYAWELAKAVSEKTEAAFFTFGPEDKASQEGKIKVYCHKPLFNVGGPANPFSFAHLKALEHFDVIHCLQFKTFVTEFAVYWGTLKKKKIFVTELGGGTFRCFSRFVPTEKWVHEFLSISEYNLQTNPILQKRPSEIIYGGVDTNYFSPSPGPREKSVLYVGRIFRLKGIHHLIEALPENITLEVVGQCSDPAYTEELERLSRGKKVKLCGPLPDDEVLTKLRRTTALILPILVDSGFTTAMEAMSCGTPVIGSRFGSLPEIITEGKTGFLVPPGNTAALREKIEFFANNPNKAKTFGENARQDVLRRFTWEKIAEHCLDRYSKGSR